MKKNIFTIITSVITTLIVIFIIADTKITYEIAHASYDPSNPNTPWTFNNAASRPIVTTAAAANGYQISATDNTSVFYSININTTATIAGSSDGYVVLEISPTNSATAGSWVEIARSRNGQAISLAVALQSVQNITSEVMGVAPGGYYVRLRSVNNNGTPTYTFVSGQEVTI